MLIILKWANNTWVIIGFVWLFYIFPCLVNACKYLSFIFKAILSERLNNSLWGSDVLRFLEFINIVSILFYNFIEFIMLLYTFLVIYFAWYRKYTICLVSSSKILDELPAFTSARSISNPWIICLGVNILRPFPCFESYAALCTILK